MILVIMLGLEVFISCKKEMFTELNAASPLWVPQFSIV